MAASDVGALSKLRREFLQGMVIPAHPLALTEDRRLDERRQVALTRYYCDAGAGGIAVGVHTTQFAIRDPAIGLFRPVLELAVHTVRDWFARSPVRSFARSPVRSFARSPVRSFDRSPVRGSPDRGSPDRGSPDRGSPDRPHPVMIAGVVGPTAQALTEAELAASLGYDAALLSLAALRDADNTSVLDHCRRVADVIPIVGFYLQPAVGGRVLDREFWRGFFEIERVIAVKVAPFDRYRTLDVTTALAESGRDDVALYTGNDDAIVADLLTRFPPNDNGPPLHFSGGLLGQWAVWTRSAVDLLRRCHAVTRSAPAHSEDDPLRLLELGAELTDANAALFDPAHAFAGCIPGIHEVLRRQGLLAGRWCLDPHEDLSPGQMDEIDRVLTRYPHLTDDDFVREHLDQWLR